MRGEVTNFMTFDAREQRKRYDEAEIEIFLFLGRELLKAQRMERLDDTLHDSRIPPLPLPVCPENQKNARSGKHEKDFPNHQEICGSLLEETCRLQEMALSIYHVGKEQIVNLTEVFKKRFEINKEAIIEMLKQNVT